MSKKFKRALTGAVIALALLAGVSFISHPFAEPDGGYKSISFVTNTTNGDGFTNPDGGYKSI